MLEAEVVVFVFHCSCTSLGALGDDKRGPTTYAREGTEPVLPLHDFIGNARAYLFLAMRRFVPLGMKALIMPVRLLTGNEILHLFFFLIH